MNCSLLVAGEPLSLLSLDSFIQGIFTLLPIISVASCLFMIFYLIRHKANKVFSTLIYMVICLSVWLFIIPFSFNISDKLNSKQEQINTLEPTNHVSAGFFRKVNNGIYYFSSVDENGNADGLYIDTENLYGRKSGVHPVSEMPSNMVSTEGFIDPLIFQAVIPDSLFTKIYQRMSLLINYGKKSNSRSYYAWISFAFMGLSTTLLLGLKRCSKWKLLNVMLILGTFALLCHLNSLVYSAPLFQQLRHILIPNVENPNPFKNYGGLLGWRGFIPFCVNGIFSIIFALVGVINSIRDSNKQKEAGK